MQPHDLKQLTDNFVRAEQQYPELMEPWSILMGDAALVTDQIEIMRNGLRETFRSRYPNKQAVS